jgi:hypothetical protein
LFSPDPELLSKLTISGHLGRSLPRSYPPRVGDRDGAEARELPELADFVKLAGCRPPERHFDIPAVEGAGAIAAARAEGIRRPIELFQEEDREVIAVPYGWGIVPDEPVALLAMKTSGGLAEDVRRPRDESERIAESSLENLLPEVGHFAELAPDVKRGRALETKSAAGGVEEKAAWNPFGVDDHVKVGVPRLADGVVGKPPGHEGARNRLSP